MEENTTEVIATEGKDTERVFQSINDIHPDEKRYGFWKFKPACLQFLNNPKGYTALFCILSTFGGLANAFLYTNVGALEQRFRFNSSQSALILVFYDVGFIALAGFLTFFGDRFNRARIVAVGAFVVGLTCLIYSIPHYVTPKYSTGGAESENETFTVHCTGPLNCSAFAETGSATDDDLSFTFPIFLVATFIMGCGLTPMITLGYSYIEDSAPQQTASIYIGLATAANFLGPFIGFLAAGDLLTKYYVDFDGLSGNEQPPVAPDNVLWVGAWWLFPLITMGLCFLIAIPLFGFPKQMPGTALNRARRVSEVHKHGGHEVASKENFGKSFLDLPRSLYILFRNPTYLLLTCGNSIQALNDYGFASFITVLLASMYHQSYGRAAQLIEVDEKENFLVVFPLLIPFNMLGLSFQTVYAVQLAESLYHKSAVIVPGAMVGSLLSGYLVHKFEWTPRGMMRFCCGCMICGALFSPCYLLYCDNKPVVGVTHSYDSATVSESTSGLVSTCNQECSCQEEYFYPSCSSENLTYFSPCQAGCKVFNETQNTYYNCSCSGDDAMTLTSEECPGSVASSCNTALGIFLTLSFFFTMATISTLTPIVITTFRVVPDSMRSFSIGVQFILNRATGTIPGPIMYGVFIDQTCLLWQKNQCDGSLGFCYIHSNRHMALTLIAINAVCCSLAALFYWLAAVFYQPITETDKSSMKEDDNFGKQKVLPTEVENKAYIAEKSG